MISRTMERLLRHISERSTTSCLTSIFLLVLVPLRIMIRRLLCSVCFLIWDLFLMMCVCGPQGGRLGCFGLYKPSDARHVEEMSSGQQPPPAYDGHKPRRDNHSVSSTHSSASASSSSRNGRSHTHVRPSSTLYGPILKRTQPAVESAVTRLLVAIKQLLESLTLWSNLQMSESQISDVYVRLGNDFNAAVAAFASFNIDMSCVAHFVIASRQPRLWSTDSMYVLQRPHVRARRPERGPRNVSR